jgi:U3 small nucleolar RNA-associated protein 19
LKCQADTHSHVTENFLSVLERLKRFPSERSDINQWWISQLGKKPEPLKRSKGSPPDEDEEGGSEVPEGEEDDWRKFFDEPEPTDKSKKPGPSPRLYRMTVHQSLHSLQSHRAVFSRAWMTLLPRLSRGGDIEVTKALAVRVLNVMHGGVMPQLTRPVLIMDWIGSCVDYGERSPFLYPRHADIC